jgi:MFS family permease
MDLRNRLGLYGCYFLGVAGIGFTLPFLPLYLSEKGMSNWEIGLVSTLAALAGLAQFPLGLWSDRLGRRKPFLVVLLAVLAVATFLLPSAAGPVGLTVLVLLFAENGLCRASVESLAGAEAMHLARPEEVGKALGALRFWKPVSIILVALGGGWLAGRYGVAAVLPPLAAVQALAVAAALLIHGDRAAEPGAAETPEAPPARGGGLRDGVLWTFAAAMILFHTCNAPGGVYLGLFLKRDLDAGNQVLSSAFVVSMAAWMLAVRPAGRLVDRVGRKPVLVAGWGLVAVRFGLTAVAGSAWQVLAIEVIDGLPQALFVVAAPAWVTDRLGDPRKAGEAQVIVGSCLVFGSAVGPLLSGFIVGPLGYRGLFGVLAAVAAAATLLVLAAVPETLARPKGESLPLAGAGNVGEVR